MLCTLVCDSTKVKLIFGKNNSCSNTIDRSLVRDLNYPALAIDVKSNTSFTIKFERTSFVLIVTGNELPTQTVISLLLWSNGIQNVRSPIIVNVSD
ncbi:hypothetical protein Lal_00027062 [Lupinus albus]|nr:hypothetical protein Lal_00027062 [Lupinus albus]